MQFCLSYAMSITHNSFYHLLPLVHKLLVINVIFLVGTIRGELGKPDIISSRIENWPVSLGNVSFVTSFATQSCRVAYMRMKVIQSAEHIIVCSFLHSVLFETDLKPVLIWTLMRVCYSILCNGHNSCLASHQC